MPDIIVVVHPRSRERNITQTDGVWHLRVTAPPVDGAANDACLELLAEALGLARRQISLERGSTSRHKRFSISGLSDEEITNRLTRFCKASDR